jgi:transcriptional regulator with XRE-family HTH domain
MATKVVKLPAAPSTKARNVAEYISMQLHLCGKSQTQIAEEVGFEKPNVITMIKQGKTKVPLNKIGSMAKALEVDPVFFFRMVMNEYMPDLMDMIAAITNQPIITSNEMDFIHVIRSSKVVNPKLRTDAEKKKLKEFVDTLKADNETN